MEVAVTDYSKAFQSYSLIERSGSIIYFNINFSGKMDKVEGRLPSTGLTLKISNIV